MSETAVEMPAAVESADKPEPEVLVLDANSPAKKTRRGKSPKAKATPKAKTAVANKKQKKAVSDMHPKYSQMINEAISALKDRNGSSRQAILKYIMANYSVLSDEKLVNNHIKMSLRAGVKSGKLRQSKGSGACGSYKLGGKVTEKAPKPKPAKATSPTKKASLTKVKKPKDMSKGAKSPAKKATDKSTPKSTPKKAKASPKKTPKVSKSPKKAKKEKAVKTPKKSKKQVESEAKTDAQPQASDSEATK